jgi:sugar-specific transcriptional regulator TrmB
VIKKLLNDGSLSTDTLSKAAGVRIDRLKDILKDLTDEGFLRQENGLFMMLRL